VVNVMLWLGCERELDDVFIGELDLANMSKYARWLAVVRVNTKKPFNFEAFFQTSIRCVYGLANDR
jgi:hypothetical protein